MLSKKLTEQRIKLYILAALVGVVSGFTAVGFRLLIYAISILFTAIPNVIGIWGWVIIPSIGGIFVAFIVTRYAPEAKGHGVPEIMYAYQLQRGHIRARIPLLKSLASAINIGSGGSCGREGPIAQIGGGAGSAIASYLKLNARMTKTLVVCGVSSGIAATFNAPLGGTLFGIEVIAGGIAGFSIIPVILASVIATAIAGSILGSSLSFDAPQFMMGNYFELFFYLILGLAFGLISVVWSRGFYKVEDILERVKISPYVLIVIGGLMVGTLGVLSLFISEQTGSYGVYNHNEIFFPPTMAVGYPIINATFMGLLVLGALLAFGILKALATSITLGAGGSGGVFAPTLYIGATLGGAFGIGFSLLFPDIITQPMAFALVGMAALFAGAGRAPITCIIMTMEMTGDYNMILPLMIAVSTSYIVSMSIEEESIYSFKLARRGINISQSRYISALKEISVKEVMTTKPTILKPEMTVDEVLAVVDATQHTKFPVVDDDGRIVGILLTEVLFHPDEQEKEKKTVKDLMSTDFLHLNPNCPMDSVVTSMLDRLEGHAVIVDPADPNTMIGFITKADVLKAYKAAVIMLQEEGELSGGFSPPALVDIE